MRRIIISLAVAAMTAVMMIMPGVAAAAQQDNFSEFCSQHGDVGVSHGACVSSLASKGQGGAVLADVCKDPFFEQYFGSHGRCIKAVKTFFPE